MTLSLPSYSELHSLIFDVDRIPHAIIAILLVMVIGIVTGPRDGNANPLSWVLIDKALGRFSDKLDRKERKKGDLIFRGFFVSMMVIGLALAVYAGVEFLVDHAWQSIVEVMILTCAITSGSVWFVLLRLYFALEKKPVAPGAYYGVARTMRANLNTTDDFGINRLGMILCARTFDKGLVGPVFWFLIGGVPALLAVSFLSALAWRVGKNGFTAGLGAVPLALDKLFGVVPSVLAAFLMMAASLFTPTANPFKGILPFFTSKDKCPYDQGGDPVSVMAWALGVSLGGPYQDLNGSSLKNVWVGPAGASAKVEHTHLRRAIYLNAMAQLLFVMSLLGAYVWHGHLGL